MTDKFKCQWPDHVGDRFIDVGEGIWWLKDPEMLWVCPVCGRRYFEEIMVKHNG